MRYCLDKPNARIHFSEHGRDETIEEEPSASNPVLNVDRSIDEYNLAITEQPSEPSSNAQSDNGALFLQLAWNIDNEFLNPRHEYSDHPRLNISPNTDDIERKLLDLQKDPMATYRGICFDEGAPQSVTGLNKWMAYLRKYHLTKHLHYIDENTRREATISFGRQSQNRIQVSPIGVVVIRVPFPACSFFEYQSQLI